MCFANLQGALAEAEVEAEKIRLRVEAENGLDGPDAEEIRKQKEAESAAAALLPQIESQPDPAPSMLQQLVFEPTPVEEEQPYQPWLA